MQKELIFREEVFAIIGAAIEVHRQLGCGFLEAVYQEALQLEMALNMIPFVPQKPLAIAYKGQTLSKSYIADFVCFDAIVLEIKAQKELTARDRAQLLNYLKATGLRLGLLINFGDPGRLDWQRIIN